MKRVNALNRALSISTKNMKDFAEKATKMCQCP